MLRPLPARTRTHEPTGRHRPALIYPSGMPRPPQGGRAQRADPDQATRDQATRAQADEALEAYAATPGASPGVDQRERKGPHRPDEARDAVDAFAAASFTKDLADLASGGPGEGGVDQEVEEEGFELEPEPLQEQVVAPARPARKETVEHGGDDPEPAPTAVQGPESPPPPGPAPAPIARIRPRARVAWLDLEGALAAGAEAGILIGYQANLVARLIPRLTSPSWAALVEALAVVSTPLTAAFVLKALAAHRYPAELPSFAAGVTELGDERALHLQKARGPRPAVDANAEPRDLRLHYDPMEALFPSHPVVREAAPVQPWILPRWLRGVPRAPLDLAVVAVDQALTEDLRPGERTGDGASDALTAALSAHGETHPSLGRWLLNLSARAETRSGLIHMREAMMRARLEMAR